MLYNNIGGGMDIIIDYFFNKVCYRIGFIFLFVITFGRFEGERSNYLYLVSVVGVCVVISLVALIIIFVR